MKVTTRISFINKGNRWELFAFFKNINWQEVKKVHGLVKLKSPEKDELMSEGRHDGRSGKVRKNWGQIDLGRMATEGTINLF